MLYKNYFKRIADIAVALILIALFGWFLAFIALILLLSNRGTPFFVQKRPGLEGRVFSIIKFKTMNDKRDEMGNLLPDADRLTFVGKIIRKTSLDETSQVFNVLFGTMSFIGPRPLLIEYLPLYNDFQKRRHEMRPGITGWAQVNGRNAISWDQKFEYDVWYIDNCTFALDMKIAWLTIKKVFKREGVNQKGKATVEYFKGNG